MLGRFGGNRLLSALELQFKQLEHAGNPGPLQEFVEEHLEAAETAETRSDVISHLGIRPMDPDVRVWALGSP